MNAQNFTQKSLEALQTAQTLAQSRRNSAINPEHLFYALVAQEGGLIPSLLSRMGVDTKSLIPRASRPSGTPLCCPWLPPPSPPC